MQQTFLVLALFVHSIFANLSWEEYKRTNNKQFATQEEDTVRRLQYEKVIKDVTFFNVASALSVGQPLRLAVNRLADLSPKERNALKGTVVPENVKNQKRNSTQGTTLLTKITLPDSVDLRTSTCMSAVKDQGGCGSCWAFSAINTLEYYNCIRTKRLALLSEQNMVDCSLENNNCNGGFYTAAWDYAVQAGGICRTSTYPYFSGTTGVPGKCKRSTCTVGGYSRSYVSVANAAAMAEAVATKGPLSVAIDAGLPSFDFYSSGIYRDAKCTTNVNHAVVIVGYGTSATGVKYWIVRNSWNTWWGVQGHILIERGVNMCGIEDWAYYPVV